MRFWSIIAQLGNFLKLPNWAIIAQLGNIHKLPNWAIIDQNRTAIFDFLPNFPIKSRKEGMETGSRSDSASSSDQIPNPDTPPIQSENLNINHRQIETQRSFLMFPVFIFYRRISPSVMISSHWIG